MRNPTLIDFYRCPDSFADFVLTGSLSEDSGFFRIGQDTICYGQCSSGFRAKQATDALYDALGDVRANGAGPCLPFDPAQVIENLRCEHYMPHSHNGRKKLDLRHPFIWNAYHLVRPVLPVSARKHLQKVYLKGWEEIPFPNWPVDCTVERILEQLLILSLKAKGVEEIPFIWFWPDGWPSCAIMTHDIETTAGRNSCSQLMDLDAAVGIKSAFQIVPEERYPVSESFLKSLRCRGFEINMHDYNHDGSLFSAREVFLRRVKRINQYGKEYGAAGFRSAGMYRKAAWLDALDFSYDLSVPNVAHLEPQRGGCCTTMPFFIGKILELPLTTTQDYSLFHILNDYSIDLWKKQIALITARHGLVSFIIHPDYIIKKRALNTYRVLLNYLAGLRAERKIWMALPGEVNRWWRERSQMRLIPRGNTWQIEGLGKERARIAYASLEDGRIAYKIEDASAFPGVELPQVEGTPLHQLCQSDEYLSGNPNYHAKNPV
jgi:hypothetical protein